MLIIGLSGKFGSGKDYVGRNIILEYIKTHYPKLKVKFLSFADALKTYVIEKYSLTVSDVYPPDGIPKTEYIRKILQEEGDYHRKLDSDYWVKMYDKTSKLLEHDKCDIIITCDVRFPNEMEYIRSKKGVVCKVVAPNRTYKTINKNLMNHNSECSLDDISDNEYDHIFLNDY